MPELAPTSCPTSWWSMARAQCRLRRALLDGGRRRHGLAPRRRRTWLSDHRIRIRRARSARRRRRDGRCGVGQLPGAIAVYRAALALVARRPGGHAGPRRRASSWHRQDDHLGRAIRGQHSSALAHWTGGTSKRRTTGHRVDDGPRIRAGHITDVLGCSITLADLRLAARPSPRRDAQRTNDGLALGTEPAAERPFAARRTCTLA